MAVLLTGGTGQTSKHLARLLQDAEIPFLLASRTCVATGPPGMPATNLDWLDSSTHENPFQHQFSNGERTSAIYLIAPEVQDPVPSMNAFIDLAVSKCGVKRFVLLSGTSLTKGGDNTGRVWQHLEDIDVNHTVLLATWFMGLCSLQVADRKEGTKADTDGVENFSDHWHQVTIKDEGKIYTAGQDGRVPFISITDIAAVAFHALTDKKQHNTNCNSINTSGCHLTGIRR